MDNLWRTKPVIDEYRRDIAVAQWKVAKAFLDGASNDPELADQRINSAVGHGITAVDAELLSVLMWSTFSQREELNKSEDIRVEKEIAKLYPHLARFQEPQESLGPVVEPDGTPSRSTMLMFKTHTIAGKPVGPEGSPYGVTHDYDCPGCADIPFTASPRSETYWSS